MKKIKLFAMDVDGTLTDGKIYMGIDGEFAKVFNVKDGHGIKMLMDRGITPVLITARKSVIVQNRADELGIKEVYQGVNEKTAVLDSLTEKYGLSMQEIAYIGDDVIDLSAMERVGLSFCPSDAVDAVKNKADIVLIHGGGCGAVREAAEIILSKNELAAD